MNKKEIISYLIQEFYTLETLAKESKEAGKMNTFKKAMIRNGEVLKILCAITNRTLADVIINMALLDEETEE